MGEYKLADSVVRVLSDYLQRRESGAPNYVGEDLLGQVQAKLSVGFPNTVFLAFRADPGDEAATATLKVYLAREILTDGDFARGLTSSLGTHGPRRPAVLKRRVQTSLAALGMIGIVVLGTGIVIGARVAPTASPRTVTVALPPPTTTAVAATTTTAASSSTGSVPVSGVSGDGGTLPKGSPVYLADLPVPNGQWHVSHGDHDVQLTEYQNSLWFPLNTCNNDYTSGEQQFRLKNFARLEVKSIGADGASDPSLTVTYEVFVNDDEVHPIASQVVSPGQAQPLAVNLPAGTFAITLRVSLNTLDKKNCPRGNAVWGSPYVLAAGQ